MLYNKKNPFPSNFTSMPYTLYYKEISLSIVTSMSYRKVFVVIYTYRNIIKQWLLFWSWKSYCRLFVRWHPPPFKVFNVSYSVSIIMLCTTNIVLLTALCYTVGHTMGYKPVLWLYCLTIVISLARGWGDGGRRRIVGLCIHARTEYYFPFGVDATISISNIYK